MQSSAGGAVGWRGSLLALVPTRRFSVFAVKSLKHVALDVLTCEDVFEKADLTLRFCAAWKNGELTEVTVPGQDDGLVVPDLPGRPQFQTPSDEPLPGIQRSTKSMMKHNSMEFTIHGIANAESYAIDLFWDVIARFLHRCPAIPRAFFDDMVFIAQQEADHFHAWARRLAEYSVPFGAFPSNDTLWHCASSTVDSIVTRLAIVNLTHEAKGLDSYLKAKDKLIKLGDTRSLEILEHNILDEVGHVGFGVKWFSYFCEQDGLAPVPHYQHLYRQFFKGPLRPPFHKAFRDRAGMTEDWYLPVSEGHHGEQPRA